MKEFDTYVDFHVFTAHSYLETCKRAISKQRRPKSDATHVASDQGLQYLLTGFSITNTIKATK